MTPESRAMWVEPNRRSIQRPLDEESSDVFIKSGQDFVEV